MVDNVKDGRLAYMLITHFPAFPLSLEIEL